MINLPKLLSVEEIRRRMQTIFPEGIEHRGYVTREMAARTVYVMLYAGALEGTGLWIRPSHVYFMTQEQAEALDEDARNAWYRASEKPGFRPSGARWYADTTREPIRDETLRFGLVALGAVIERNDVPTTSPLPRFAMARSFATLFSPKVKKARLDSAIKVWQETYLGKAALSRVLLIKAGMSASESHRVSVCFPNGETRRLTPGRSSLLSKAVVEEFAKRFLSQPAVLWLSESGNKVVSRDDGLASALGLEIDQAKSLPDIILVDLGKKSEEFLIVFVEVVATDGPINRLRKDALQQIALAGKFNQRHLAFLTVFEDRSSSAYRKVVSELAWGTYVWFASEPDNVVVLQEGFEHKLKTLR